MDEVGDGGEVARWHRRLLAAAHRRPVPSPFHALAILRVRPRPSWEYEAPRPAGPCSRSPGRSRSAKGLRGKVADRDRRGHRPRPRHRAGVRQARLQRRLLLRQHAGPGRQRAGAAHRDRAHRRWASGSTPAAATCATATRSSGSSADTRQRLGGIHFLVNNAGIASDGALWRLSEEAWREVLDTNVTGAFNCIRAVAPIFRSQHYGKIVSVSAHQAERPGFGVANYAASKAALLGPHPRGRRRARPGQRERERRRARVHPHRADGACCRPR